MSETVQVSGLRPAHSGHANRTTHGGKGSGDDFDAALGEVDERQVPARDSKAVSGKHARQDRADDDKVSNGRVGGEAAFFARLFGLGDRPAVQRSAAKHPSDETVQFKVSADDEVADEQDDGGEAAAPALAAAVSTVWIPARGVAAEPAAGDKKPAGKAANAIGDAVKIQKAEAAVTSARDAAKIEDAAGEAERKSQSANPHSESAKDHAGGQEAGPLSKVKVVSAQTTPAPLAAQLPSATATALARAIHTGMTSGAEAAHAAAAAAQKPAVPAAVHTLNIQLQPETLGTVTARLHLSGDNLRVELQVDNADAHRRLRTDSDVIVNSLRALGYDVDRITIQAPSPGQPAASGHNAASQGREQSFQQAADNSGNGQGSNHAGSGRENGQDASHQARERPEQHSPSRGLFI